MFAIAIEESNSSEICVHNKLTQVKPFKFTKESIKCELMFSWILYPVHLKPRDVKVGLWLIAEAVPS
jgi:hypothetical protein